MISHSLVGRPERVLMVAGQGCKIDSRGVLRPTLRIDSLSLHFYTKYFKIYSHRDILSVVFRALIFTEVIQGRAALVQSLTHSS